MNPTPWKIDASHSGIHFTVRHMVISKVRGHFSKFEGEVTFDEAAPEKTKVKVNIDASSISTNEPKRDDHLRSPDFFDVAKFPALTFESTKTEKKGDRLAVTGNLSMHGVTREVVLDAELLGVGKDPWGGKRAGFTAKTSLDRKDFGLGWNQVLEAGGVLVGDKIEIELEVEAIAPAAVKAA
ncbi:MAG: polyisoprenoid-binding protein [Myxococcaceae bacterium]|nr:polyisoprenoid-binding protein [Myxococcaceae bacterium]